MVAVALMKYFLVIQALGKDIPLGETHTLYTEQNMVRTYCLPGGGGGPGGPGGGGGGPLPRG